MNSADRRPGILPCWSYRYSPQSRLPSSPYDPPPEAFLTEHYGKIQGARVLFCLARDGTADSPTVLSGGVLVFRMHDFCGGVIISSAWSHAAQPCTMPTQSERFFTPLYVGYGQAQHRETRRRTWEELPAVWDSLPDVGAYAPPPPTLKDRLSLIDRSLAAGVISYARGLGVTAVLAADRLHRPATSPLLELMPNSRYFAVLPGVRMWPGERNADPTSPAVRAPAFNYAVQRADVHKGNQFYNPNSGRDVRIDTAMLITSGSSCDWSPPVEESEKFSPAATALLPQQLFHN